MTPDDFLNEWRSDSPVVSLQTSGSTGAPKAMVAEKCRMAASARLTCEFLGIKAGDTALLCMSVDFIAGKMMVVRSEVCGLRLISVEPSGHPLASVGDTPIDFAAMVPMQVYNSLQEPVELSRLMSIKHLIIGGGHIPPKLENALKSFPNAVWSTYGMTETLSHIALRKVSGSDADDWYTPFPSVDVSLSTEGCLIIDAPDICPSSVVTNDICEIAPDGRRFRVIGRKDNVICSGGVKIHIEKVEELLDGHLPGDFAVAKRRDDKFGEVVVLLFTEGEEHEIEEVCRRVLPAFYVPKVFVKVDEVPRTPTGKKLHREID